MPDNSNDPEYLKRNFEAIKNRFRITGATGTQTSWGDKNDPIEEDKKKDFENKKRNMSASKGTVTFNVPKVSPPNARQRKTNNSTNNSIKVFTLGKDKEK